jgi:hypothetical protein
MAPILAVENFQMQLNRKRGEKWTWGGNQLAGSKESQAREEMEVWVE